MRPIYFAAFTILTLGTPFTGGAVAAEEGEFAPLFNGQNLDGWVRVNTAASTWTVEEQMLICSGKPIGELRTTEMFQNFILELEWRHMKPRGNAGVFVWADDITARGVPFHRSIEVQVLENAYGNTRSYTTHGDIFPIHGAVMTPVNGRGGSRAFPTMSRSRPSPQWNHYRIECRDGAIALAVNGKVVTRGTKCSPRKGYICLESEGGVVHYRNMRIKRLPDSPIEPAHVATANRGYRTLYSGLDLAGWRAGTAGWQARDWVLAYTAATPGTLTTEEKFGEIGFVFDVRLTKSSGTPVVEVRGVTIAIDRRDAALSAALQVDRWNRFEGELRSGRLTLRVNGKRVLNEQKVSCDPRGPLQVRAAAPVEFANLFVRKLGP